MQIWRTNGQGYCIKIGGKVKENQEALPPHHRGLSQGGWYITAVLATKGLATMDLRERVLFHQIHPLKLVVDWVSGLVCAWLLWKHRLSAALVVGLIPPVVASAVLMRWANLNQLRESRLGRYVSRHMTRSMEAARLAGMILLGVGAWYHRVVLMVVGVAVILAAWARGKLVPTGGDGS